MKRSGFLKKLLLFIVATVLLNAILTLGVFTFISRNVFANMKANEMLPKASFISNLAGEYQQGALSATSFERMLNSDQSLWDAAVYIFDASGAVLAEPVAGSSAETAARLETYRASILSGGADTVVTTDAVLGIIVGVPVCGVDASVTGAVLLIKPLNEVNTALNSLNKALWISIFMVFLLMLLPAYWGSRSITQPLSRMSLAARAMATGDYSVRADVHRQDELGELGGSLNDLADALKQTIGDLVTEKNRIQSVLDGLHEGVIAVDLNGEITSMNPACYLLLDIVRAEDANTLTALQEPLALAKQTALDGEARSCLFMVQERQLAAAITTVVDQHTAGIGAILMLQDVTEAQRLEQTRRDYVANVSHELRTPIASIRSLADALNDGMVKKEEDKCRYYGYILRESMRLGRLIDDLLELSRLQSGGVALTERPVELEPLLRDLAERFTVTAGDSGLTFSLELPEEAPSMRALANEDRVEQVCIALLDNAVKYAADGGTVTLSLRKIDAGYEISVCNTGHINEADLPHLFERFYKADKAHTGSGTGLGLAIAREIIHLMGQRIWAENRNGQVAFCFTLAEAAQKSR
ncbi:MAG: histidine kinase dimerization/phospho-acceptor domain-containing protein [Eubacteriales bacterium]|nr:histidine kinase dimerization/phospho-acceptor domain-containing protein [Eubacteriales bacterium]